MERPEPRVTAYRTCSFRTTYLADAARRSAEAVLRLDHLGIGARDFLKQPSVENATGVHVAFGGSTNLLLHQPAIAHAAEFKRPLASDWGKINRRVPHLVDALPNVPGTYASVQIFLASDVFEVILHLRYAGLLDIGVRTVTGVKLDAFMDWWQENGRRHELKATQKKLDGIDPDNVILSPELARSRDLTPAVCFPIISPEALAGSQSGNCWAAT